MIRTKGPDQASLCATAPRRMDEERERRREGEKSGRKNLLRAKVGTFSQFAPLRFVCVSHPPIAVATPNLLVSSC